MTRAERIEAAAQALVDYGIGAPGTRSMPTSSEMVRGLFADLRHALASEEGAGRGEVERLTAEVERLRGALRRLQDEVVAQSTVEGAPPTTNSMNDAIREATRALAMEWLARGGAPATGALAARAVLGEEGTR